MDWFQEYWWTLLVAVLVLPVVAAAVFARWLKTMTTVGYEDKVKSWDVFVKLISAFTVVAGGAILIGKYFDQREQVGKQQEQRSNRRLICEPLNSCVRKWHSIPNGISAGSGSLMKPKSSRPGWLTHE